MPKPAGKVTGARSPPAGDGAAVPQAAAGCAEDPSGRPRIGVLMS